MTKKKLTHSLIALMNSIDSVILLIIGQGEIQLQLDWPTRQRICIGIAKGLAFLHEESTLKIVHRDIKATNVLLDRELNPKISDFGLAKLDEEGNTHISTRIAGTMWATDLIFFSFSPLLIWLFNYSTEKGWWTYYIWIFPSPNQWHEIIASSCWSTLKLDCCSNLGLEDANWLKPLQPKKFSCMEFLASISGRNLYTLGAIIQMQTLLA